MKLFERFRDWMWDTFGCEGGQQGPIKQRSCRQVEACSGCLSPRESDGDRCPTCGTPYQSNSI